MVVTGNLRMSSQNATAYDVVLAPGLVTHGVGGRVLEELVRGRNVLLFTTPTPGLSSGPS